MKKILWFALLAMFLMVMSACGEDTSEEETDQSAEGSNEDAESDSGEQITWKLGHLSNEEHSWHQTAVKFAELVDEKTDGQLQIEIYPNEQLGSETDVIDSIQAGTADMTMTGESMANWAPETAMMGIPYGITSEDHLQTVVEGEIGEEIEGIVKNDVGLTPLYYHVRAPRNLTSNEPINSPEDLNGFKMRVPNVPIFMDAWSEAGASPQTMAFSEVFTGLQQGVIDGQENPVDLIHSAGFYEVQEYVNETEHVYGWVYVVVGNEQFNALDEDMQDAVMEAAEEVQSYAQELYEEDTEEYTQLLKDEGMTFNDEVDQEAFAEAMRPAIEENLSEEQLDLYERIVEAGE
ncbi:TRAP transporter substrate-binding protein [Alteribacillus bidgolensis]|uniref:Tripartite ATP-independent transporter solute receptor, DctP family n=1 Tax=Alteribacillus bidgolensis TaxID=930129 RepID=A0A1G8EAR6_9BACI|nr:TRAP transporter substrate-binding protein [Alteribacillus bidgolensis]SDH67032.1 tripartite ATP-independent transporter solute receptor, DctP family [Alteribacillus bidgolensis]